MKTSPFARAFELAKLTAKVGAKELRSSSFESRVEQALLIAKSLSNLKGAAMKAGQLLSLDLDNYFPPEAIEVLGQLQNAAVAHPYEEIEKLIKLELGSSNFKKILSIDPTPLGVASIGQVHKASYLKKDIVIKVQFNEVADSIDADLKILKTLATAFCQMTGRKMNLDPLFNEFKSVLEQEVDYRAEQRFQNEFSSLIESLNSKVPISFSVPQTIPEICTSKVLTMEFKKGVTFRNWLATNPSRSKRDLVGKSILDLYFHEFFEWGLVQTDPNWGNFLVDESAEDLQLVLLDFGATREYKPDFVANYIALLDAAAENNAPLLRDLAIQFGFIDYRESKEAFDAFQIMLKTAIKPFFIVSTSGVEKFDFTDRNHTLESQSAVKNLSQHLVYSPPPYSIIFLHRKLAGVYSILKSLEVKMDITSYWEMMKELSKKSG